MPESFLGSRYYLRQAFWAPAMMAQRFGRRADWKTDRSYGSFFLYGRLISGVTMAQAETDLSRVAGALAQLYPRENADSKIQLTTELDGRYWDTTWVFQVRRAAGLVCLRSAIAAGLCQTPQFSGRQQVAKPVVAAPLELDLRRPPALNRVFHDSFILSQSVVLVLSASKSTRTKYLRSVGKPVTRRKRQ